MRQTLLLYVILLSLAGLSQDLVINEAMSSNSNTIRDEDGDSPDWIEIYNSTDQSIQLSSYFISDDKEEWNKWQFPPVVLGAKDFVLVFCSGKDMKGTELHSNFKLKAAGEKVYLSKADGTNVHSLDVQGINTDESIGSITDGDLDTKIFVSSTPGNSNSTASILANYVQFSKPGGIYATKFNLELLGDDTSQIYYTIDGNLPTTSDIAYSSALSLDETFLSKTNIHKIEMSPDDVHHVPLTNISKCIVLRAAKFYNGTMVGDVATSTYFIKELGNNHEDLPLVSLVADSLSLFDNDTGVFIRGVYFDEANPNFTGNYFQSGVAWERLVNIEYYHPNNTESLNQMCGLRIHGSGSRKPPQKAMRLYARSEYGESKFRAQMFTEKPFKSTKRLILKPFYASWSQSGSTDYVAGRMARNLNLDYLAADPCILYVNGEYWGIYFLQERLDEKYIEQNYGVVGDSIDVIESWRGLVNEGSNKNFTELYRFFENNSLVDDANYRKIEQWIDIDNFIDYQIFEAFISNYDWPSNNMKCWRERKIGAKWRWIFFDADGGLENITFPGLAHSLDSTSVGWPTNPESTIFLRKLMQNEEFRIKYATRLRALLNGELFSVNTLALVEQVRSQISGEITTQSNRFNKPTTVDVWSDKMTHLDNFMSRKPCIFADHAKDYFGESFFVYDCATVDGGIQNLLIVPNPTSGSGYIVFSSKDTEDGILEVYTTQGQMVLSESISIGQNINTIPFNMNGNLQGMYIVRVTSEHQSLYAKVVLE